MLPSLFYAPTGELPFLGVLEGPAPVSASLCPDALLSLPLTGSPWT
jgi:hypothetical protein